MNRNRRGFWRRGILLAGLFLAAVACAESVSAASPRLRFGAHSNAHPASFHGRFYGGRWGWGWGWGGWYNPWWGPWGGYYGYSGYPRYERVYGGNWTAVKTDVEPDEAALYLDGRLIGTADDFDGFPDQLYLKPGHYTLEFRLEGYEPYSVEIDAAGSKRFDVDFHMKKIPGARQYGTYTPAEPPGGVVRHFAKRGVASEPYGSQDVERYRRPLHRRATPDDEAEQRRPRIEEDAPPVDDEAARPGDPHFYFEVTPADAAIYVDARFAGTARELNNLAGGLEVAPGEHEVTVVCPDYRQETVRVTAQRGEPRRVRVRLSK